MTNVQSLTPGPLPIGFDSDQAAAELKQSLIERFCTDDVTSAMVSSVFSIAPILKKV